MSVQLLTPFTQVDRRSAAVYTSVKPVSGSWVTTNSSGEAILPTSAGQGNVSFVLEGIRQPTLAATIANTGIASEYVDLPSAVAANQVALAYGIFRFEVGHEGYIAAVETADPGDLLYVDTNGRLSKTAGAGIAVAVVESASATRFVARTLANG